MNIERIEKSIEKKQKQLSALEIRITPLLDKKRLIVSKIQELENKKLQIRHSKILGIIGGIKDIDTLTPEQIKDALSKAANAEFSHRDF